MSSALTLFATGHRPQKLGGFGQDVYEDLFALAYAELPRLRADRVISGMALGWDTAIAEAALMHNLELYAYVPFAGQELRWAPPAQRLYNHLLSSAAKVVYCSAGGYAPEKMDIRNRCMVDDGHQGVALWDGGERGGTFNCVEYALRQGKAITNLWSQWENRHG